MDSMPQLTIGAMRRMWKLKFNTNTKRKKRNKIYVLQLNGNLMKKIYLAAMAVAALTVSSCSQDEVLNINPEAGAKAIEFGVYTGKAPQVRGVEVNKDNLTQFGVSAVYSDATGTDALWESGKAPNFMYNEDVNGAVNSTWSYDPVKYWPADDNDAVSFFAYAPMATTTNGITIAAVTVAAETALSYTLQDNPCDNADFVAAAVYNQRKGKQETAVSFTLKHELTRVDIQAAVDDAIATSTNVILTDVRLYGPDVTMPKSATYTYSTTSNEHGTWTPTEYYTSGNDAYNIAAMINKQDVTVAQETFKGIDLNQTFATIFKQTTGASPVNNYLFLLPPNGQDGLKTAGDVTMEVDYTIATVDNTLSDGKIATKTTKVIKLPTAILKQGVAYVFKITVGLDQVKLAATLDDDNWGDDNDYDVTVNDQKDDNYEFTATSN